LEIHLYAHLTFGLVATDALSFYVTQVQADSHAVLSLVHPGPECSTKVQQLPAHTRLHMSRVLAADQRQRPTKADLPLDGKEKVALLE
jgi:hypothetical protein